MATAETTVAAPRVAPKRRGGWFRRHRFEIALVTPLVVYVLVLTVAPIIDTFRQSFSSPETGFGTLKTFQGLFQGFSWSHAPEFQRAIINTIIVAGLSLILEL